MSKNIYIPTLLYRFINNSPLANETFYPYTNNNDYTIYIDKIICAHDDSSFDIRLFPRELTYTAAFIFMSMNKTGGDRIVNIGIPWTIRQDLGCLLSGLSVGNRLEVQVYGHQIPWDEVL